MDWIYGSMLDAHEREGVRRRSGRGFDPYNVMNIFIY